MHYMLAATSFTGLTVQQGLENAEQQAAETIPATALPMPDTICPEVERLVAGCYRPEYAIRLGLGSFRYLSLNQDRVTVCLRHDATPDHT